MTYARLLADARSFHWATISCWRGAGFVRHSWAFSQAPPLPCLTYFGPEN